MERAGIVHDIMSYPSGVKLKLSFLIERQVLYIFLIPVIYYIKIYFHEDIWW